MISETTKKLWEALKAQEEKRGDEFIAMIQRRENAPVTIKIPERYAAK